MRRLLAAFVRKELSQSLRDPRSRLVLFVVPFLQMLIFGYALSTDFKGLRLALDAPPGDRLCRQLAERAAAAGFVLTAGKPGDPYGAVLSGAADAVLVAPPGGLARAAGHGDARPQLLVDASNPMKARALEQQLKAVLETVLRPEDSRPGRGPAFPYEITVLYNGGMRTQAFLVPGVVCMTLAVLTVVLASMAISREKETGTYEMLLASPSSRSLIYAGKTLPYVLLGLVDAALLLGAAISIFGLPLRGQVWQLALASLLFVGGTVGLGALNSVLARTQQQAMVGGFAIIFPAILLSGMASPLDAMPWPVRALSQLNPLRHYLTLLRLILLKGADPAPLWLPFLALTGIAVLVAGAGLRRLRQGGL